jgi:hypothetical protein
MAKYQYRLSGPLDWIASSGNALVAISNPPGSGKKFTIRSVELVNKASIVANVASILGLVRCTVSDGVTITPTALDTDASWPTTVRVSTDAAISSASAPLMRVQPHKALTAGLLTGEFARQKPVGLVSGGLMKPKLRAGSSVVESIVVRDGEAVALNVTSFNRSVQLRVSATLVLSGTPDRTFVVSKVTSVIAPDIALFAVNNTSGSGETVTIRDLKVEETGTPDTPFFQLVPISSIEPTALSDGSKRIPLLPLDTAYPDGDTWISAVSNAPVLPFGLPQVAFAEGSAGTPKGFNYLQTKDFLGPVYRTMFPEFISITARDTFNSHGSAKRSDMFLRRAPIVLREGEGIALVSGAETALVTVPVGVSGWASWEVAVTIDVEPSIEPTLTISGLTNPSEVRIFDAGTTTLLAGQENVTTGSFSWVFDPDETPSVDIAVLSLGYQNIRLTNFALTLADATIPVQQQVDRQYANP